jgi:hypothetical protein
VHLNCDIHGAIHEACESGYKDIVQILIKHNVDINQHGGFFDKTPIYDRHTLLVYNNYHYENYDPED